MAHTTPRPRGGVSTVQQTQGWSFQKIAFKLIGIRECLKALMTNNDPHIYIQTKLQSYLNKFEIKLWCHVGVYGYSIFFY